jgi:tetratricopeptide (TPR) repeat protein
MRIAISISQFKLLLIVGSLTAAGIVAAPACEQLTQLRDSLATGDWAVALGATEACVKSTRASAPSPPVNLGWPYVDVASVYYWELDRAILNAKLGNMMAAEKNLADALAWRRDYNLVANDLVSVDPEDMAQMTRGYLDERRGDRTGAAQEYGRVNKQGTTIGFARARLALLALDSGDESKASIEAGGDQPEPTALYVRGALAERQGAAEAAIGYYELALNAIGQSTKGNRSIFAVLLCIDRDRIVTAVENARRRQH